MKKGTAASIQLTTDSIPDSVKTSDELATYAQGIIKGYFFDAEFSDTSSAKVGSMDAVEYTYTVTQRSMKWKFRMIYVMKDGNSYTITCSALEANFDEYIDEFQTMADSYSLK